MTPYGDEYDDGGDTGGGYVMAFGTCDGCHNTFSFNPRFVPSLRVGDRQLVFCGPCIAFANTRRVAAGVPPHVIHPQAYEPLPENLL